MTINNRITKSETIQYCSHANCDVTLKSTHVFPADIMPETPPRISNRKCSHFLDCNLQDKSACILIVGAQRKAPGK